MRTFNDFKESSDNEVYVCGTLAKKINGKKQLLLVKEGNYFKPCGKTLRFRNNMFFDHIEYIHGLTILMMSLQRGNGQALFSESQVKEIIEYESFYDKERGSIAPYFRSIIYAFIKKIGIYPAQLNFIARTEKKNRTLATYFFSVRIAWSPKNGELFDYIDINSTETSYGDHSLKSENIALLECHDPRTYQGSSFQYKKLYKHIC